MPGSADAGRLARTSGQRPPRGAQRRRRARELRPGAPRGRAHPLRLQQLAHRHSGELSGLLHRGEHIARARAKLHGYVEDLLTEAVRAGDVRDDTPPDELTRYYLHALAAAAPTRDALDRLVTLTLAELGSPSRSAAG